MPNQNDRQTADVSELEAEISRVIEQLSATATGTGTELGKVIAEYKNTLQQIQENFDRLFVTMSQTIGEQSRASWTRFFADLGAFGAQIIGDIISRGVRMGLQTSLTSDVQTSLDALSGPIANMLSTAIGVAVAKNPVSGAGIGAIMSPIIDRLAGPVLSRLGMELEGYRMVGARAAPIIDPGFLEDFQRTGATLKDFGQFYTSELIRVQFASGATAESVLQAWQAFSRLGIGLASGGSELAEFTLALEKTLNLKPGTILQVEMDIVRRYGENLSAIIPVMNTVVDTTRAMSHAYANQSNATAGAFRSAQNVIEALSQISSQARNSQVSIETLTSASALLLRTAVTPGTGRALFRPEEAVRTAGVALAALMPSPQSTTAAEAMASGLTTDLLSQSELGREVLKKEVAMARTLGLPPGSLETAASMMVVQDEDHAIRRLLAMSMGVREMIRREGETSVQLRFETQRGVDPRSWIEIREFQRRLGALGVFEAEDPLTRFREVLGDPQNRAVSDEVKKYLHTAKEIGDNSRSMLDRIASNLQSVSEYFQNSYFSDSRNAVREAFGLEREDFAGGISSGARESPPSLLDQLSALRSQNPYITPEMTAMESDILAAGLGRPGDRPTGGQESVTTTPVSTRREAIMLTPHTQDALVRQEVASKSALIPTGSR